mgnify:CR=1 FL=1
MGIIFATVLIAIGIVLIIAMTIESIEIYYDTKERLRNED